MDYNVVKETAGDRIVVLTRPLTLPGCCAICGYTGTVQGAEADVRVFIDFNLDLDFYGRVYWCSSCLLQASNVLGWLGVEQAEEIRGRIASQESELIVLREQNERLRASLASLLGQSDSSVPDLLDDNSDVVEQGNQDAKTDGSNEGRTDSSPDESVGEQGSTRVPDSTNGFDPSGTFSL